MTIVYKQHLYTKKLFLKQTSFHLGRSSPSILSFFKLGQMMSMPQICKMKRRGQKHALYIYKENFNLHFKKLDIAFTKKHKQPNSNCQCVTTTNGTPHFKRQSQMSTLIKFKIFSKIGINAYSKWKQFP